MEHLQRAKAVIHLFQTDSLELRGHLVMVQSTTLQGQAGLSQELKDAIYCQYGNLGEKGKAEMTRCKHEKDDKNPCG